MSLNLETEKKSIFPSTTVHYYAIVSIRRNVNWEELPSPAESTELVLF
jgi:hypothetical protein